MFLVYLCKIWVKSIQISLLMENMFWEIIFCIILSCFSSYLRFKNAFKARFYAKKGKNEDCWKRQSF